MSRPAGFKLWLSLLSLVAFLVETAALAQHTLEESRRNEQAYNDAINFERGGQLESAIAAQQQLLRMTKGLRAHPTAAQCAKFDSSQRLALLSMLRLGRNYQRRLAFADAARAYETFLDHLPPPEADACQPASGCSIVRLYEREDVLRQLIFLRGALGPAARRESALQQLKRLYLAQKLCRSDAAVGFFASSGFYDEDREAPALRQHLEKYLQEFANKGGPDRARTAHLVLGRSLLSTSCPVAGELGLCVERRVLGSPACGPANLVRLLPRARGAAAVEAARQHLRTAIKLEGPRSETASIEAPRLRFLLAELAFEDALKTAKPPTEGLSATDPVRNQAAQRALAAYFQEQQRQLRSTESLYQQVVALGPGEWAIAAMLRIGQLYLHLAVQLDSVPRPGSIPKNLHSTYCAAIENLSAPMREQAANALSACVARAVSQGIATPWSRRCEELLHTLRPKAYPIPSEITPALAATAGLDVAPVVSAP